MLAVVGAWDDIRPLSPALRLPLQFLCVGIVVFYAAPDVRLLPETLPLWAERGLALEGNDYAGLRGLRCL